MFQFKTTKSVNQLALSLQNSLNRGLSRKLSIKLTTPYIEIIILLLILIFYNNEFINTVGVDFYQDYSAAINLSEGRDIYGEDISRHAIKLQRNFTHDTSKSIHIENFHPPSSNLYYYLFHNVNFLQAAYLHSWMQIILLVICIRIFLAHFFYNNTKLFLYTIIVSLLLPPNYEALIFGQNSLLISSLLILGITYYLKRKFKISAILFALATIFKLYPLLILFPMIINKNWKAIAYYISSLLILFIFSIYLVDWRSWQIYLDEISKMNIIEWSSSVQGISFAGIFLSLFYSSQETHPFIIHSPEYGFFTLVGATLLSLAYFLTLLSKFKDNIEVQFYLTLVFLCIISPVSWPHSLYLTMPLFFYLCYCNSEFLTHKTFSLILIAYFLLHLPYLPIAKFVYSYSQINGYLPVWSYMLLKYKAILLMLIPYLAFLILRDKDIRSLGK